MALHDIGKFSRAFQAKAQQSWPTEWLGPFPTGNRPAGPPHDATGFHLLFATLGDRLAMLLPQDGAQAQGWQPSELGQIWSALTGHHGRPPDRERRPTEQALCSRCREAAAEFIEAMVAVFHPPVWPAPQEAQDVAQLAWQIAGVTTLADWIGSRREWFPYVSAPSVADPGAYFWGHALPHAAVALAAAGLAHAAPASFDGLRRLFPAIIKMTPVQQWAETVPLPEGPLLAVIEDLTGSGKTEAALTLAHRLLAAGRASGVYVALPTMATANAMFRRLADSYQALFAPDTRPSLALAHSRAAFDTRFAAAIVPEAGSISGQRDQDPADEPAEAHCTAWLAQDQRRALLAQVGVGTLDQALLAVLPVRHAALRLHAITNKVLIVDEVHACDPYMREELATLLRFHAALGGSAVLLSATLPHTLREKLVSAFRDGLSVAPIALAERSYPLATIAGARQVQEAPCAPREGLPRRVTVRRLPDPDAAIAPILEAVSAGAAVVWVRNTVDDALAAATALRARGRDPLLFHARFALWDRLRIEGEVLRRFGRNSGEADREAVLVATQVVEQSLDIDFDLMVTDLAPADLLIQRAGRLWRHCRERPLRRPELLVVSPEPVAAPDVDWIKRVLPGTSLVYPDHALLWRSARELFRRGALVTPDDMRPVIEVVFDRDAVGAVPPALASSDQDAYGAELSRIGLASQHVLDLQKGYRRDAGLWEPDTRIPTRIEERPHVTLRLALVLDGCVVPYALDPDTRRAWSLSEVAVARYRIAACPVPAALQSAAEAARRGWGRWERESPMMILAVLMPDGNGYRLDARDEAGAAVVARYDARTGLSWLG